jgi:glycosyltransferase involved in cell wall biosynthesis
LNDTDSPHHAGRRLAFVPPRYGDGVVGGAEAVVREMAHGFAERGWEVDLLTTCARDHFTWANEYPAGVSRDGRLSVRRFPTVVGTDRSERMRYEAAILAGQRLTVEQQERWMNGSVRVPELFHHVLDHAAEYRAIVFAPYLFWPTFACAQVAPERTVLMPCLHDEPYARLEIFQPLFSGCAGMWFLSEPEHQVAHRIFALPQRHQVVGSGVRVPEHYDPEGFRARHDIDRPFLLFAGRREGAKGWERMLDAFACAVERHRLPFALVTMGAGPVHPPLSIADRVIDLGFLDEPERDNAFAAADAYIQPSQYESFSRTIMEAWLAGTLVIANGASEVVRWHCDRSGAGLTYDDDLELAECLRFVAEAPRAAARLADRGRAYVLEHYAPDVVLDAQETTIRGWFPQPGETASAALANAIA